MERAVLMRIIDESNESSARKNFPKKGFSLVEMLTVMAIVALLSLGLPAIQSLVTSGTFNSNTSQMNDLLQGAYSAAVAKKTYVWVGFEQMPNNGGVGMAFVYSLSGNPTDINTPANLATLSKPVILKNLALTTVGASQITNPSRIPAANVGQVYCTSNTLDVASTTTPASFSTEIGGATQTILSGGTSSSFTTIMQISPSGQVSIASNNKYAWLEVGLQSIHGNSNDVAVLQMNSFTGRVVQFSP